jgi:hypothetical protein
MFPKSLQILIVFVVAVSCKPSAEQKALDLIDKSIEAHGGKHIWVELESISFVKETKLFRPDSSLENHLVQEIEIRFRPNWEVKMSWQKDSILHRSVFDGKRTRYWLGENEIQNTDFLQSKKRDLDAAAYVMTKPFDLVTGKKRLTYLGLSRLPDGKEYESLEVVDGTTDSGNADVWVYFFDPKESRLEAYSVKTSDHTSLVFNEGMDFFGGVLFPQARKSYRLLENGQVEFLRAEYTFSRFQVR